MNKIIPSHDIAQWLLKAVNDSLAYLGIHNSPTLEQIIYVIIISAFAIGIGYVIKVLVTLIANKIIRVRKSQFAIELISQRVVSKCSHIIPPLVLLAMIPFAFDSGSTVLHIILRCVLIYLIIMFGVGLTAIITFAYNHYNHKINKDNHPIKGVVIIVEGIVWIIIVIVCASILIHKSPMVLLGGLGAFAAALMLIFKDSILGFVAGIQLSTNDMLRVGDWIVVPGTLANGIVIDVSLTVVKVQNWDNTTIMLPPYTLVSESFQNWRGMSSSGVRQIDRKILIDNNSITVADDALIATVTERHPEMAEYVAMRRKEAAEGKAMVFNGGTAPVNGTIDTNLGLFRAYFCKYLLAHPAISHDSNIIVRLMDPQPEGTPLDIYCFTNTTDWLAYEAIRSQIFEHVIAAARDFGLRVYNTTDSGRLSVTDSGRPSLTAPAGPQGPAPQSAK